MEETKLLIGKVERLENHFQVYKNDMNDVKDGMKDLRTAIIGNDVNGNKGFLHLINKIDEKVDAMESKQILLEKDVNNAKYVARTFWVGVVGFIFWLFQK